LPSDKTIPSESQIWSNLCKGDMNALALIYDGHVGALYNFGNKICRDVALVEDAIHDLFTDIWKYRENLSSVQSTRAYLYASLRRKIVRKLAENNGTLQFERWQELNLITESAEAKRIEKEASDEKLSKLKANLNNLSPRQYEAIILKFYDDMSYQEIGEIMEMNEQSARNLIQRGLENLRQFSKLVISVLLFWLQI
jgi:RNA polymerase sigma factor (sigma-70 family)